VSENNMKLKIDLNDGFDTTIVKSWFKIAEERQDSNEIALSFVLENQDKDSVEVAFYIGPGWEVTEGGRYIKDPTRGHYLAKSEIGYLIARVVDDLDVHMHERGVPTDAEVWVGLRFHWKLEEVKFERPRFNEEGKIVRLMPVRFLDGHENGDAFEELAKIIQTGGKRVNRLSLGAEV